MAVTLKLEGMDPAAVAVTVSPLTELMAALHVLAEPDHHPEAGSLVPAVTACLDDRAMKEFRALSPLWARFRCRVLFPLVPPSRTLPEQLTAMLSMPLVEFVRLTAEGIYGYSRPLPSPGDLLGDTESRAQFVQYCRTRSTSRGDLAEVFIADPEGFRARLVSFLAEADTAFFTDSWDKVGPRIQQSVARTRQMMREQDVMTVLSRLSPSATAHPLRREVTFDKLQQRNVPLAGRSLLLVPSVWIGPHLTIKDTPGLPVVVHYPVSAVEEGGLAIRQIRARLAALASESRLEIVRHLSAEPITTSELAARLHQDPAQVSRVLSTLREVGLITSARRGKQVHHRLDMRAILDLGPDLLETFVR